MMDIDVNTDQLIINYVLEYTKQSRKLQKPVPRNMWIQIATKINEILELNHPNDASEPVNHIHYLELRARFERFLIFELDTFGLTANECFTVAYPHLDILKKLQIVFISCRTAIFNIDDNALEQLAQIIAFRLNRYTYNHDIWDVFDALFRMGVRKLEINVENSLFGLNPEEKLELLSQSRRQPKSAHVTARLSGTKKTTNNDSLHITDPTTSKTVSEKLSDSVQKQQEIDERHAASLDETRPNPNLKKLIEITAQSDDVSMNASPADSVPNSQSMDINEIVIDLTDNGETRVSEGLCILANDVTSMPQPTDVWRVNVNKNEFTSESSVPSIGYEITLFTNNEIDHTSEDGEIHLHQKDVSISGDVPGVGTTFSLSSNETLSVDTNHAIPVSLTESEQQSSCDVNMVAEENIISQRHQKNNKSEPLVHWSLLFDLFECDISVS